jgi:hypothetical protein
MDMTEVILSSVKGKKKNNGVRTSAVQEIRVRTSAVQEIRLQNYL